MKLSTLPSGVLRLEYAAVRFPLRVLDQRVFARYLSDDAPVRLGYERLLGLVDRWAGQALEDEAVGGRGDALRERSDALEQAARLDAEAAQQRSDADAKVQAEMTKAREQREEAERKKSEEVAEARRRSQAEKRRAEQEAKKEAEAKKETADEQARKAKRAAAARKKAEHDRIATNETQATQPAKAKLSDAVDKQSTARAQKAAADRLDELAAKEKEDRRSGT
jgi:hypothetical protein